MRGVTEMTPAEFNLKTLRQACGSLRPPPPTQAARNRQRAVLRSIPHGSYLSLREIGTQIDIELNQLASIVFVMHRKGLLDRIGDRGDYLYTATAAGRALCD